MTFRMLAIVASTLASAALVSVGWSDKAEAQPRLYISPHYAAGAVYYTATGLPWYAVRAYYFGGPWIGPGFSYAGWDDYAARNGIACRPGTLVKGGDGLMYLCQ
jgi:hypothetical protein